MEIYEYRTRSKNKKIRAGEHMEQGTRGQIVWTPRRQKAVWEMYIWMWTANTFTFRFTFDYFFHRKLCGGPRHWLTSCQLVNVIINPANWQPRYRSVRRPPNPIRAACPDYLSWTWKSDWHFWSTRVLVIVGLYQKLILIIFNEFEEVLKTTSLVFFQIQVWISALKLGSETFN